MKIPLFNYPPPLFSLCYYIARVNIQIFVHVLNISLVWSPIRWMVGLKGSLSHRPILAFQKAFMKTSIFTNFMENAPFPT